MDLNQRPPRSPRTRLGGYVLLPRLLDKARAELAGTANGYHYACPNDQRFLAFTGINADALKTQIATGAGDGEILEWIRANQPLPRAPWEIEQWSAWLERRTPASADERDFFNRLVTEVGPKRNDLVTFFDAMELDDFVSYGGKA